LAAYVIFTRERTTDKAELDLYAKMVGPAREGHNMTARVRYGAFEMLEGDPIEGVVVLEFPTVEEARAWYRSPLYQAALKHRLAGAEYRVFIVQGAD
jgi:uncharacterized protein (DUF1330 family)